MFLGRGTVNGRFTPTRTKIIFHCRSILNLIQYLAFCWVISVIANITYFHKTSIIIHHYDRFFVFQIRAFKNGGKLVINTFTQVLSHFYYLSRYSYTDSEHRHRNRLPSLSPSQCSAQSQMTIS